MSSATLGFLHGPIRALWWIAPTALLALIVACVLYVPGKVDGGWYAYPALALVEGRDPGDNQKTAEQLLEDHRGTKAKFYWDSRRNLYVLAAAAWFSVAGADFLATRLLSMSHLALYLFAAFWLLRRYGGNRTIALLCFTFLLVDTVVVASGTADMRPDLLLGATAIGLYLLLLKACEEPAGTASSGRAGGWRIAAALLLASVYPLIHLTAPVSMAVLWSTVAAFWWYSRRSGSAAPPVWVWLVLGVTGLAFIFHSVILDVLIATEVPEGFAQSAVAALLKNLRAGPLDYLAREVRRWMNYGASSNVFEMVLLAAGAASWLVLVLRRRVAITTLDRGLLVGLLGGLVVVALCSPYPREDHLVTLIPFMLLATSRGLTSLFGDDSRRVVQGLGALALVMIGVKFVHAGYIVQRAQRFGFSNDVVNHAFHDLASPTGQTVIIGPTELWPYLPRSADVVIIDERANPPVLSPQLRDAADYIVVSKDTLTYGWPEAFLEKNPAVKATLLTEFGHRGGGPYFGIYSLRSAATSMGAQ